jgi:4-hydroxybenzoyl-CoA reductase subunit beta
MKVPKFEYVAPQSMSECCKLLEERGTEAHVIAGGTDLIMALKNRLKVPKILVDMCRIPNLNRISFSEKEGLKVGALVSLRHLAASAAVREKYPILAHAALDVGSPQIQAMGSIGGNLCQDTRCLYYNRPPMWRQGMGQCHKLGGDLCHAVRGSKTCWATYCGDIAPVLLVLRARIKITNPKGEKVIPLSELYSGDGKAPHTLQPGQVIKEVQVPGLPDHSGGAYLKLRVRKTIDYPLLGVAVTLALEGADGTFRDIKVALTGVEKAPLLIEAADELKGEKNTEEVIGGLAEAAYKQAHPINNTYGLTPEYRRDMVRVYVKSAIHQSLETAIRQGGAA